MDPIGASASLVALIDATFLVVEYLSDLKDGGKERVKLLAEVSYMWCTLDGLKEKLDPNAQHRGLLTLDKPGGPLDQCRSIVSALTKELTSKDTITGRIVQRLRWSFKKEDVHLAVEQLHRIQVTIAQQITLAVTEQIQHDSATARQILDDQQEQRIRNWLSPLNFVAQQKAIYENHCSGTGAQFLQSKQLDVWRKNPGSTMWCRGPPGAGKTYLSSIIVHELQEDSQAEYDIGLVVYCRYDDPDCQDLANIVGDLLKQCLKDRQVPDALVELFRTNSPTDTRPTFEALLPILFEQLKTYRKCYIVIDALDELANSNDRSLLVAALRRFQTTDGTREAASLESPRGSSTYSDQVALSLIIMSRDLEDISAVVEVDHYCDCCIGSKFMLCNHFEDCIPGSLYGDYLYNCQSCALPQGTIPGGFDVCQKCYDKGIRCPEEEHPAMIRRATNLVYDVSADEEDIRQYLQWRIEHDASLEILVMKKDGLRDHVLHAVVHSSGSMFLLAKLTIDAIAICLTVRELKLSLQQIPTGLNVAYDATVQRILLQGEARSRRAFKVMKWVFLAWRPLTSAEMEHAVSIEHGSDDIDLDDIVSAKTLASLCAGLVVIDQYGDFRFAHQTVPEYLKASHPDQFYDTDTSVVDGCLTYLLYTTFTSGPCADLAAYQDRTSRYPLYSYCSRYWYKQQNGTLNAEQKQLALQFFRSEPLWRSSRQAARSRVIEHGDILPPQLLWGDTMLHHAAYLDAHHLFEDLLEEDPLALNGRNEMGRTPLMRAAVHGSLGFASKLIQAGAEINVLDVDGDAALHLAVWKENLAMVNLLVTSPSVDINLRTAKTKNGPGGGTALTHAAGNGASAIVERLIEAGADVNAFNNAGYSALHMAAIRGHPQTVEILLAATQININGLTRAGGVRASGASALMLAAEFGHADVVKNFLKAGADAMIAYRNGDAAIHVAVISGHVAVVEALLEFNVEIDTLRKSPEFEHDGFSPLMLATLDGSVQMLKILLTSGRLNVNLQSSKGKSALMIAVKARQIKAAKLLLAHEMIDVDVADDDGWTPLMVAADIGLIEIIPELIAKGANVNAQSKSGWTPILLAAEGNHTAVVEVLSISDSIVLNTPETSQGRTALHYAIGWANAPLVKLLLSEGADLQIRDKTNHFKAIDYARYFKDKGILDLLEASGEKGTT